VLVSAIGAAVDSSFFYARVKGELERDVRDLNGGSDGTRTRGLLRDTRFNQLNYAPALKNL
jgi:uncharacterized protein YbjT (DUF2867 family)